MGSQNVLISISSDQKNKNTYNNVPSGDQMCLPTDTAVKGDFLFFFFLKEQGKLGIVMQAYSPGFRGSGFKSNLSYKVRVCLKRTRKKNPEKEPQEREPKTTLPMPRKSDPLLPGPHLHPMGVGAETWACSDLMERTWVPVALRAGRRAQKQLVF